LLAIDPVGIRIAATESYFPAIMALCVSADIVLLYAVRAAVEADSPWRAAGRIVAAGFLLVLAGRIHPVAWGLIATVPFIIFAAERVSPARRLEIFLASVAIIGGLMVATSGGVLLDVLGRVRSGTLMRPPALPLFWPLATSAAAVAAYATVASHRGFGIAAG